MERSIYLTQIDRQGRSVGYSLNDPIERWT